MLNFEIKYVPKEELSAGIISNKKINILSILLLLLAFISIYFKTEEAYFLTATAALLSIPLVRLISIDLSYFVLPNVYTLPILALGLIVPPLLNWHSFLFGLTSAAIAFSIPAIFSLIFYFISKGKSGIGAGDLKLFAALAAWLNIADLPIFMCFSFLFSFVLSLMIYKNKHIPMGPGIILSFWVVLLFNSYIESLLSKVFMSIN